MPSGVVGNSRREIWDILHRDFREGLEDRKDSRGRSIISLPVLGKGCPGEPLYAAWKYILYSGEKARASIRAWQEARACIYVQGAGWRSLIGVIMFTRGFFWGIEGEATPI